MLLSTFLYSNEYEKVKMHLEQNEVNEALKIINEEIKKEIQASIDNDEDLELDMSDMDTEQKNKWIKKLFTYTKEFFEAAPDTDF